MNSKIAIVVFSVFFLLLADRGFAESCKRGKRCGESCIKNSAVCHDGKPDPLDVVVPPADPGEKQNSDSTSESNPHDEDGDPRLEGRHAPQSSKNRMKKNAQKAPGSAGAPINQGLSK